MNYKSFIGDPPPKAIDGKGRTIFPSEFRRQVSAEEGNEFVLTCGPDRTLILYVLPEYEKFMAEIDAYPDRSEAERFRKQLAPTVVELDGQNRILIPKKKLDFACLTNEVLYAPARGKSLELWNPERYNAKFEIGSDEDREIFDDMFWKIGLTGGPGSGK